MSLFRTQRLCAAELWGGEGAGRTEVVGLPLLPVLSCCALAAWRRRTAPRPEVRLEPGGRRVGGRTRGRPLVLLFPGLERGALTENRYEWFSANILSAYQVQSSLPGAVEKKQHLTQGA